MEKDSPIGFFDSGVGGLSVYARFRAQLPSENTIYYGDLKNLPYGNKTKEQLIGYTRNIMDFFKSKNVKAVVIACNTSSALAYETIKNEYEFKIYPIIQSSVKLISELGLNRIGVFATQGTVSSGAYRRELLKYNSNIQIREIACPNWVSIVEGRIDNGLDDIKLHLDEMLDFEPDKIILGCTHYPYLLDKLGKFTSDDLFIDPAEYFIKFLRNDLVKSDSLQKGYEEFYVSAEPDLFIKNAKKFYDVKQAIEI